MEPLDDLTKLLRLLGLRVRKLSERKAEARLPAWEGRDACPASRAAAGLKRGAVSGELASRGYLLFAAHLDSERRRTPYPPKTKQQVGGLAAEHTGLHGPHTALIREARMPVELRPREASRAALAAAL